MRFSTSTEKSEEGKGRIIDTGLPQVRLQEARFQQESGTKSWEDDPTQATAACGCDREGRTEIEDVANRQN
jgi:hypothetical protein